MHVRIAKVGEALYDGEAESLHVPGSEGELTILPHHEPFITALKAGKLTITTPTETKEFDVKAGVVEVSGNEVIVLL